MAERKAVNKYYPPDWDPRKGSVNKRVGQHPLRDRARKLSQGILVIRFELPYNIWCGGCGSHVGMGVRYNAEKSKVGNYYSTPIYKFRMKCHLCDNYFEIQTDPKNHDYVILNGARRKEQRWDPVANGQIMPEDKTTQKKLATDPMYKLEHGSDDHLKGKEKVSSLAELEEGRISMIDDYLLNRMARDKFRSEKQQLREAAEADKAILDKSSLDIELVEESEEDKKLANLLKYSVTTSFEDKQKQRRKSIEQQPIFGESRLLASSSTGSSSSALLKSLSSSSSSFQLSQPLSYQRHARPKLSQRGQIKQKLGWAIKSSLKKSSSDKSSRASQSITTNAMQKQLGIKLKACAQAELSDQSEIFESKSKSKKHSSTSDKLPLSKAENDSECHNKVDQLNEFSSDLPSESTNFPATGDNQVNISTSTLTPVKNSTNPLKFNSCTTYAALDNKEIDLTSSQDSSNTGLQALMSSYGASDSDSS